jgi:GntR family transcriptional regulator
VATLRQLDKSTFIRTLVGVLDPTSDRPMHRQLADSIRDRIASGELAPGARLPSEMALEQETGLNRSTVRRAIEILRSEGLVDVRHPHGTFVRKRPAETVIEVSAGTIRARMPNPTERRAHGVPEGVPILVVDETIYPADRTALRIVPRD